MYTIRHILTGTTHQVSKKPVHLHGTWECGDLRFTDPNGQGFEELVETIITVPDFWKLFTMYEESLVRSNGPPDPVIVIWLRRLDDPRTTEVNLSSQELVDFLGRLVDMNLIKKDRAAQITAGTRS